MLRLGTILGLSLVAAALALVSLSDEAAVSNEHGLAEGVDANHPPPRFGVWKH